MVSPFANREVGAPLLQRWYSEARGSTGDGEADRTGDVTFQLHYVTSHADAHKRIHKELEAYAAQHRCPTVALLESSVEAAELALRIPFLQEVPTVAVAANLFDGQYASLGWQVNLAALTLHHPGSRRAPACTYTPVVSYGGDAERGCIESTRVGSVAASCESRAARDALVTRSACP